MLRVADLELTYRTDTTDVRAVRGVSFTIEHGQFFTLLGPSGCGKTSTLRSIAGLEIPSAGQIRIGEDLVFDSTTRTLIPPHQRDIGMVFQSYAIWPHMTVFQNVAFPLEHGHKHVSKQDIREKVMRALSLVQLDNLASRPAPLLSGGQQQRVALARSLVHEPTVLLLDEPLSNLDAKLREDMRHEIKLLVHRLGITTLYVTHDQLEALAMSDTVALMSEGEIVQSGAPRDVYLEPSSSFVANFLGRTNLLDGTVARLGPPGGAGLIDTAWGQIVAPLPAWVAEGHAVMVGFRPEGVLLTETLPNEKDNVIPATVASAQYLGDSIEYQLDLGSRLVRVKGEPFTLIDEGQRVFLRVPPERCYVLEAMGSVATAPA
ncbi:MAG TPA: ABC transporter ATP-binding protein [Chloroflexota bacterium]|nr:ABC transporter ATP-binding protein [Chloroflexota bacterium]